jgi:hypothetical protein
VKGWEQGWSFLRGGQKGSFLSLRAVEGGDGTNSLAS